MKPFYLSCPQSEITTATRVLPESEPTCSIAETTSCPETTFPNITCLLSSQEVSAVQRQTIYVSNKVIKVLESKTDRSLVIRRIRTLTSIGVFSGIGHAQDSRPSVLELKLFPSDGFESMGYIIRFSTNLVNHALTFSSSNFEPYILSPPVPLPRVKSPP